MLIGGLSPSLAKVLHSRLGMFAGLEAVAGADACLASCTASCAIPTLRAACSWALWSLSFAFLLAFGGLLASTKAS